MKHVYFIFVTFAVLSLFVFSFSLGAIVSGKEDLEYWQHSQCNITFCKNNSNAYNLTLTLNTTCFSQTNIIVDSDQNLCNTTNIGCFYYCQKGIVLTEPKLYMKLWISLAAISSVVFLASCSFMVFDYLNKKEYERL
jgi:hypothetical protein